jgi:rod shape-determining protein MreD
MKHLLLFVSTYLALATQAGCGTALSIGDCRPPLMWLPVVLALSWFADAHGVVWAAFIGLLADGLSSGRFGVEMLATTLTAVMLLPLRPDAEVRSRWPRFVWQFSVIATGLLLSRGFGGVLSDGPAVTITSLMTLAGEAAYGLALCMGQSTFGALRTNRAARYHHA